MTYCVPVAFSGLTHAARVMAPPGFREGLSGAEACCLLPFRPRAAACPRPTEAGPRGVEAWLRLPVAASRPVPVPSSVFQWATSASAAGAVVHCQACDHSPLPAAFEALTR